MNGDKRLVTLAHKTPLSERAYLKVCTLQAVEMSLEHVHVNDILNEEFLRLAEEKNTVYTLSEFAEKFNQELIHISSGDTYIRVIECNK